MRGLKKPQPPRNVSPDGQQKRTWAQAEKELRDGLPNATNPVAYARLVYDSMEKQKLRAIMYREQGGLCIFCERRIKEGQSTPRIDHWRPLSKEPNLAVHWRNLHLSCATEVTCDCRKDETQLRAAPGDKDLPWPVDHVYEHCVGFTSLGEAYVRTDAPLDDAQRRALTLALGTPHSDVVRDNGILNLNHPALVAARVEALDNERSRMERKCKDKTATRDERVARASALLKEQPLHEFISIRVRWLDRSLGKAK